MTVMKTFYVDESTHKKLTLLSCIRSVKYGKRITTSSMIREAIEHYIDAYYDEIKEFIEGGHLNV